MQQCRVHTTADCVRTKCIKLGKNCGYVRCHGLFGHNFLFLYTLPVHHTKYSGPIYLDGSLERSLCKQLLSKTCNCNIVCLSLWWVCQFHSFKFYSVCMSKFMLIICFKFRLKLTKKKVTTQLNLRARTLYFLLFWGDLVRRTSTWSRVPEQRCIDS